MNELLRVSELGAGYGQRGVLKGVSFSLGHGEICALLGANGSGKSTLMRALCGLIKAEGECTLGGENLWKRPQRRRAQMIGYLAQRSECALSLSSLDIVLMGYNPVLGLLERPGQAQRERALEMLGELGGAAWAEKDFGSLSEGQRQLVLFARTLVRRPPLLLLDEPDSALDYDNRHRLLQWLREYARREGAGILLCSHDANIALRYADRLLLLREGRLMRTVPLEGMQAAPLQEALSEIYGPVDVIRHAGYYLMTRGEKG